MVNYKNWIGEINDDTKISKLSIPGTHNSAACHTALPSVQCQGASVTEQLEHGVRFLDIRVGKLFIGDNKKDLQVIHGKFPVKIPFPLKLTEVLEEVYKFLEHNRSETVIVSIKQEGSDDWDNQQDEFGKLIWDHYVNPNKDRWYLNTDIPRVRDARGKALLFRRFGVQDENLRNQFGFGASSWSYNTTDDDRGSFVVQDFCEVQSADDLPKKIQYVKDLAKKAQDYTNNHDDKLFLNFTSGSNFFDQNCWPQPISEAMIKGNIQETFHKGVGIIVLDYAEAENWKMSKKPDYLSNINDEKLRKIIEGTNLGQESKQEKLEEERKKLEKEREVSRKLKAKEREEEEKRKAEDREAELSKVNKKHEANFSTTDSGKLKGVDEEVHDKTVKNKEKGTQQKLRVEDKIIASTEDAIDESDIPNLAKEINETIQEEIGDLPSQKAKQQSQLAKKVSHYLDSAHDTILTVTRALNDVTGYSAIERLKKSIQNQEEDLKKAKEEVKKCKLDYSDAIQKRSHSQREVNELLTRKHNWSSQDLERFTELYRNDHENENNEQKCEQKLQDVESKVDGIQLKLTQSILTRYHEEQIWSDKIRRSSTWGTWILMGLNVLLFVFATFIVEPWKRAKLVKGFEDKVKNVLVGISQQNEQILEPIIEQLEQDDGDVSKQSKEQSKLNYNETESETGIDSLSNFHFKLFASQLPTLKEVCVRNYKAIMSPQVKSLELDKFEFGVYTASLLKELDLIKIQEEYIKDEQRHLKRELIRAQEEVKRIKSVPLVIGQFLEPIDENTGIVSSTTGSNYVVRILSTLDRELLKPSSSVALHRHSNALVDILPPEADSSISIVGDNEKPDVTYADIGGLDMQKQEIVESVELPLEQSHLYSQIGIDPPRGVLLYGPPGTGKTMLVKAVANATKASFIRINGSEFVQKYLGEGPRMVRDVFRLARENSPAIIFIDEIDAIATKRFDAQTGADREVQRILLELLNQMDGFDQTSNVKVIMATNRADTLDPALLRPGRLDRKIEFPNLKDRRERRLIFTTIASKMSLAPEVDLDSLIIRNDPLSGAVIAAIMQEAGLRAVRKNRYMILQNDLEEAYSSQVKTGTEHDKFEFYK
ncbi:RPT3 [Candida margitis]|uniref:RPT3 n=1 Tax=Candida margitis TaxID=1775924 RepID=UPI0022271D41|nr:RPT3 [Candida margitis]KAI5954028.1 RPT3 [Candida margitis]